MYPIIQWLGTPNEVTAAVSHSIDFLRRIDADIGSRKSFEGFCVLCGEIRTMTVSGGALFGPDVNLREGMVCQSCGLSSRSRLLYMALRRTFPSDANVALLEAFSPLATYVASVMPNSISSEYKGRGAEPGKEYLFEVPGASEPLRATHQDLMSLGFPNGSLAGIVHNDVLEHVPDAKSALTECHRVLKKGGVALFTMPWFPWLEHTLVRGVLNDDGTIEDYLPAELHGDPLSADGVYTFYNFGADIHGILQRAGFADIAYGLCYDPFAGFVSNNYRYGKDFLTLPIVIRARRTK